jgi:Spy/CpxP family protein refolding chaperone
MRRITVFAAIVGLCVLTACGAGSQADGPADGLQLDAAPCSQVLEAYDEHQQQMARTFGDGVEGREAQQAVVELIEARPDCFREDTVESARALRELLPASDAEREAIEAAEARCADGVGGGWATSKDSPDAATPEDALADAPDLPRGEPEPVAEADDWVAFDFFDAGVYEGHAIVQHAGDGWYVRRAIDCRRDDAVAEQDGDGRG